MKLPLLLFVLIFTQHSFAQEWWEDQSELKGAVNEIYSQETLYFDAKAYPGQDLRSYYTSNGELYKTVAIYQVKTHEELRILDEKTNQCLMEFDIFDGDTSHLMKHTYDSNGQLIETIFLLDREIDRTCTYSYNSSGLLRQKEIHFKDGQVTWNKFEYDDQQRKIQLIDSSSNYYYLKKWHYNDNNQLVEFRSERIIAPYSKEYTRVHRKNKKKHNHLWQDPNHAVHQFAHNEKGQRIKETINYLNESAKETRMFSYNEQGDINKVVIYDSNDELDGTFTIEFTYDAQGNWIKKRLFYNEAIQEEVNRQITYY